MRVIKFRAWHKKDEVMHYDSDEFEIGVANNTLYQLDNEPYGHQNNDMIPMQFTGLHDKNGKEIYEGDIVRVKIPAGETYICQIVWSDFNAGFSCNAIDNTLFISASGNLKREGEVIGNIYENPELLK